VNYFTKRFRGNADLNDLCSGVLVSLDPVLIAEAELLPAPVHDLITDCVYVHEPCRDKLSDRSALTMRLSLAPSDELGRRVTLP
jgi:hypothetical protein